METAQLTVLDFADVCSFEHLVDVSGLTRLEIGLLVDSGVILPVDVVTQPPVFHLHYVVVANTARRLRDDFELDGNGMALALALLQRIRETEAALAEVRAQLAQVIATQR